MKLKSITERLQNRDDLRPALYSRVSTTKQANKGYSLGWQLDRGYEVLNYLGIQLENGILIYQDGGVSGRFSTRPDWDQLKSHISSGKVNLLLVTNAVRVGRETYNNEKFRKFIIKHNAEMLFLNDLNLDIYSTHGAFQYTINSAVGTFFVSVIILISQWERETISERTCRGVDQAAIEGIYVKGRSPYGYKIEDKKLVIVDEEAAHVRELFELYFRKWNLYGNFC